MQKKAEGFQKRQVSFPERHKFEPSGKLTTMADYKVVNKKGKEINTNVVLHPGDVLEMELHARQIRKSEFASMLGMTAGHFSELIHSKRHVSAGLCIKLEKLLGIKAEYWMRIQVYHDLYMERLKSRDAA
jgi:addiction module HigA family antidote